MKKIKVFVALALVLATVFAMSGCGKTAKYENYSYGIEDTGYYKNLDKYPCDKIPDFSTMSLTYDEVIEWGWNYAKENGNEKVTNKDTYVYEYATQLMYTLGLASKDTCANGDTVKASLQFFIDGQELKDFTSTSTYVASAEGDAIVKSFIDKKLNEEYEVEYTFPENDADYPNKLANVKVKLVEITSVDPIKEGFVEKNIAEITKYLDGVTDTASFLKACEPKLAESTTEMYLKDYLTKIEGIEVPNEYAEYEMYRLKARLNQLGYTYEKYLEEIQMTDEEAKQYCKDVARENYIYLLICQKYEVSLTTEQVQEYYGANFDTIKDVQGVPYMKLNMLRDAALYKISTTVKLVESK